MVSGNEVAILFSGIGAFFTFFYYLNRKDSVCNTCKMIISHRKENRYYIYEEDQKLPQCKKCYQKSIKNSHSNTQKAKVLKALECSCCGKIFSNRMKINEWKGTEVIYYLCVICNKEVTKTMKNNFRLDELLNNEFVSKHTSFSCLDALAKSSKITIEKQSDFSSEEWNQFIINNSSFESWMEMADTAELQLLERERDKRITLLKSKNV